MLAEGNWNAIQKFRKFQKCTYTKLRDSDGAVLNSDERAEGLAKYLEDIQWAVRPDTIPSEDVPLFNFVHLNSASFTESELRDVLFDLKKGKK